MSLRGTVVAQMSATKEEAVKVRHRKKMIRLERIICPVDLSLDCDDALRYAASLARASRAKLFVCYCVENLAPIGTLERIETGDEVKRIVEGMLDLDRAATGAELPNWESVVMEGKDAADAITREAAERRADLIVMCSRRRPVRAALLGSTAESVYRHAPCPVLIMHPDTERATSSERETRIKRVLVAYDFSDYSELALRYALTFAEDAQAELHLLHVLSAPTIDGPEVAWVASSTEAMYHKTARGLQQAVPDEALLWCDFKHAVRWGKPYREILSYAEEHKIDLLCMGAHGTGFGKHALFGSNVDRVLRQAPCPMLIARPLKPTNFAPLAANGTHASLISKKVS